MSLQETQDEGVRLLRPVHATRTAASHAAFLLPHLRPGMDLLDLGCGPGSITLGLAAAVAPGQTVGVDLHPQPVTGIRVVAADAARLPFPDGAFDAIHAGALLQHVADPLAVLREARRVARPGAVIGLADADWDGELLHPADDTLRRSLALARRFREGTSPYVGRRLRELLVQAGFRDVTGSARAVCYGTPEQTREAAATMAALFAYPAAVARALGEGWATEAELAAMSRTWQEWGEQPGAYLARFWCEAVGWA
ncbi:methyltransferase domain-containing protein [Catellatospora bangladeshensis]|uniref:Methyltransferase type 11 domain-containing protein n=1 Tax=Catellatospora bangladeshensis TaxID=310355 RepID=A0A8J3JK97_9ACTN|nr:methyltransferase domain-containing protein [Catellatospora bangladeshensis]GIF86402.1 hypothetical protein Cba03nite_77510 [Catellatospora bangladeshensis]